MYSHDSRRHWGSTDRVGGGGDRVGGGKWTLAGFCHGWVLASCPPCCLPLSRSRASPAYSFLLSQWQEPVFIATHNKDYICQPLFQLGVATTDPEHGLALQGQQNTGCEEPEGLMMENRACLPPLLPHDRQMRLCHVYVHNLGFSLCMHGYLVLTTNIVFSSFY